MRVALANKYIRGRGIELGALHCPLPVPSGARVIYVDRMSLEELKRTSDVKPVENDILVDDAEDLDNFEQGELDFIIGNHVLEHCRDIIGTLKLWSFVLARGGVIYAAIPEKTQTFDRKRPVTSLEHSIAEHEAGDRYAYDEEHYREYLSNVDNLAGPELEERVRACLLSRANIHFHAWDRAAQHELMNYAAQKLGLFEILEAVDHGAEIIWILRKK